MYYRDPDSDEPPKMPTRFELASAAIYHADQAGKHAFEADMGHLEDYDLAEAHRCAQSHAAAATALAAAVRASLRLTDSGIEAAWRAQHGF